MVNLFRRDRYSLENFGCFVCFKKYSFKYQKCTACKRASRLQVSVSGKFGTNTGTRTVVTLEYPGSALQSALGT